MSTTNKSKRASLEQIFSSILPNIADDRAMKNSDLFSTLERIAKTDDGKTFVLRDAFEESEPDSSSTATGSMTRLGGEISHNAIVLALAEAGGILGFDVWIGKPEQAKSVKGRKLGDFSMSKLPKGLTAKQKRLVQQIDCIWFKEGIPVRAFEVEHSTDIEGAFKRFLTLLELNPNLAGKLQIIAADSKQKKLRQVFTESVYVGQPYLMQSKVGYCFVKAFVSQWNTLHDLGRLDEADLFKIFNPGTNVKVDVDVAGHDPDPAQLALGFKSSKEDE